VRNYAYVIQLDIREIASNNRQFIGYSEEQEQADDLAAQMAAVYDPTLYSFTFQGYWILLNKFNTIRLLNLSASTLLQIDDMMVKEGEKESPRDSWDSNAQGFKKLGDESASGYESVPQPKGKKTKIVPPETILAALENFAGIMARRGFKTGRGTLLTQLFGFITRLVSKQPIDYAKLDILLQKINFALSH
jgi:hypothetical protein